MLKIPDRLPTWTLRRSGAKTTPSSRGRSRSASESLKKNSSKI